MTSTGRRLFLGRQDGGARPWRGFDDAQKVYARKAEVDLAAEKKRRGVKRSQNAATCWQVIIGRDSVWQEMSAPGWSPLQGSFAHQFNAVINWLQSAALNCKSRTPSPMPAGEACNARDRKLVRGIAGMRRRCDVRRMWQPDHVPGIQAAMELPIFTEVGTIHARFKTAFWFGNPQKDQGRPWSGADSHRSWQAVNRRVNVGFLPSINGSRVKRLRASFFVNTAGDQLTTEQTTQVH